MSRWKTLHVYWSTVFNLYLHMWLLLPKFYLISVCILLVFSACFCSYRIVWCYCVETQSLPSLFFQFSLLTKNKNSVSVLAICRNNSCLWIAGNSDSAVYCVLMDKESIPWNKEADWFILRSFLIPCIILSPCRN